MTKATMAIGVLAVILTLSLLLFLLLHLSFSLLRRRTHPPYPLETPSFSPANFSPAKLSPFYAHGVIRAPKRFLLSSPKLDAIIQPPTPSADATERFVCISNPVFDSASGGSKAAVDEYGDRSPELKVMKKLPLNAMPAPAECTVDVRWSLATSVSAKETNRASSSSEELCSSPSW